MTWQPLTRLTSDQNPYNRLYKPLETASDTLHSIVGNATNTGQRLPPIKMSPSLPLSAFAPQQKTIGIMREDLAGAKEARALAQAQADSRAEQITELKVWCRIHAVTV